MAIPGYQTFMLPLLKYAADGEVHVFKQAVEAIAEEFNLSDEERKELLPSGQRIIANRVGWARTYLKKAGLLDDPMRGHLQITESGKKLLKEKPAEITIKFLLRYDSFKKFRGISDVKEHSTETEIEQQYGTPEEALAYGYKELSDTLADGLLEKLKSASPAFFEQVVVELLVKMGYGGSFHEAALAVGKSGDAGIDGIIKEDKLGLDTIYIQAKRWADVVGRPEIQKFAGALLGQKARKGIFVTTSHFSREAIGYAQDLGEAKIVLIDGKKFANLMIETQLGVSTMNTYEIKKIDIDYFEDEKSGVSG